MCKFAEGDSRILMMKMSRDRLKHFEKSRREHPFHEDEDKLCSEIMDSVHRRVAEKGDKQKAIKDQWEKMYSLAGLIINNTVQRFLRA